MLPEYIKYYYKKLPEQKKSIYLQMYKGFRAYEKSIAVTVDPAVVSPEDLLYVFTCLYNDTPSFYYLEVANYRWFVRTPTGYVFIMKYQYSDEEIRKLDKDVIKGLQMFGRKYIREEMTEYEKELVIHDYLVRTVTYDHESLTSDEQMAKHGEIFNILGPLLRKKAVCWGIACAFKLLCDYCHIKCFVVIGRALNSAEDEEGHAWNIVRLDNQNYHVDVTWDIKRKGDISFSYDYFNLNDPLIRLDHTWDDRIYPSCRSLEYNYHHRNRLYVRALREIPDYIRSAVKSGNRYITFKFANEMPSTTELQTAIFKGMRKIRYYRPYRLAVNMDTHNVYIDLEQK